MNSFYDTVHYVNASLVIVLRSSETRTCGMNVRETGTEENRWEKRKIEMGGMCEGRHTWLDWEGMETDR